MEYRRNQDVTKVFDARWKANNNDDIKRLRDRDNIRQKKIFSSNPSEYLDENDFNDFNNFNDDNHVKSSMEIQLERLNRNMEVLKQNRGNFNG